MFLKLICNGSEPNEKFTIGLLKEQIIISCLLLFTDEALFLLPNMALDDNGELISNNESKNIDNLKWFDVKFSNESPLKQAKAYALPQKTKRKIKKVNYDEVTEIHRKRYWLKPMGIELFQGTTSFFFITKISDTNLIYSRLFYYISERKATISLTNPNKIYFGLKMNDNFHKTLSHKKILNVVEVLWEKAIISNFEYLAILNFLSGRTNNDISQYPIMPWIISNYESEQLDLENEGNFRNLMRPVGALTQERSNFARQKFNETFEIQGKG